MFEARLREQYSINYYDEQLNVINAYTIEEEKKRQPAEYYKLNKDELIKKQNK